MSKQLEILKDFAQFKKGQLVKVDDSYTPTSQKLCERYVASGKAAWHDDTKKTPKKKEDK